CHWAAREFSIIAVIPAIGNPAASALSTGKCWRSTMHRNAYVHRHFKPPGLAACAVEKRLSFLGYDAGVGGRVWPGFLEKISLAFHGNEYFSSAEYRILWQVP